jgi:hypothetical protein
MTCETHRAGTIELYFYGELDAAASTSVQTHLKQCAECRSALEDLTVIRAALATRPDVATPPGGDWSGFMARLDGAIAAESRTRDAAPASGRVIAMPLRGRLGPYLAIAAMLALVTFTEVMLFRARPIDRPVATPRESPTAAAGAPAFSADPALVALTDQHFERSKLVVLGLTTRDPAESDAANWAYERELASTLLSDTRLYRIAAEERGMSSLAGVMRDLELVLLQTSMSEQPDAASLEQLQRLIRRRDLITKMNVIARQ